MDLVRAELPARTLVVAIDPGKVTNRVLLADGERGLVGEPVSLPTLREGIERLCELIDSQAAPETVIAIEATGSLHLPWVAELERRLPGSTRLFAPSETQAARTQLGSGRFKDDDRDCAALISLARQGGGRPAQSGTLEALLDAVRHRRRLIAQRRVARQHLHHQLNNLCPGLSAPAGHGRVLGLETPTGQAVLACAVDFAGRAPAPRSLIARAPRRLSRATAEFWAERWRGCLAPPPDAELRAERLGRDVRRWRALQADVDAVEAQIAELLAQTPGRVLATLPGVAATRAAAFCVHALPIERFPTAERLYSFTGLAPARYESATIRKARAISRTAPGERRDALMGIAWGLSQHCRPFKERDRELRARGMRPIEARVALARHACRLCHRMLQTQQPFDEERYARTRHVRGR
jgi:transposase